MGLWSLYFLAKVGLYWGQVIGLHWAENLAFAAALAWPLQSRRWRMVRHVVAWPLALALLYQEAPLPPWTRLLGQLGALSGFSLDYGLELAGRFIAVPAVLALAGLLVAYALLQHRLRFATLAVVGLLTAALLPAPGFWARGDAIARTLNETDAQRSDGGAPLSTVQLDARLAGFYATERNRVVPPTAEAAPGFDIVVLSVCSLSWDDLDTVRMRDAPLMSRFDIVFNRFNSAATYSGPAVLRLLRARCGQAQQSELYQPAPDACRLFAGLEQAGYEPAMLMNHSGRFDDFAAQMKTLGGWRSEPRFDPDLPSVMQAFDGSPIQSDYEVLSRWWQPRSSSRAPLALLYNTITLHDGNRMPGRSSQRSADTYQPRLQQLFSDLDRFIELIAASGRPTLLVMVPEHGGAVHGDGVQVSGLREIPTLAVTSVPAAVKLIGFKGLAEAARPIVVTKASSYLALGALIEALAPLRQDLAGREQLEAIVADLPATDWVAENDRTVLLRQGDNRYLRSPQGEWTRF